MPSGGRADPSTELSVHDQDGQDHAREESEECMSVDASSAPLVLCLLGVRLAPLAIHATQREACGKAA